MSIAMAEKANHNPSGRLVAMKKIRRWQWRIIYLTATAVALAAAIAGSTNWG